jgi:DNA topoisomerase VI subunit A
MLDKGQKAEIEALDAISPTFLVYEYLPAKTKPLLRQI